MGEKGLDTPKTPQSWAIRITYILNHYHKTHGDEQYPVKIAEVAEELSKILFPEDPITLVEGRDDFDNFEGALIPRSETRDEWGIIFNSGLSSKGRINFTLAHEFGHYLLHRHLIDEPKLCARNDMWAWDSEYGKMESEANEFASYLLMPLDDFRKQTKTFKKPNIYDFDKLSKRYGVSLTAAILKWLDITDRRAMIVVSRDGFIDWARSSEPLMKSGVYLKAKQEIIPVPAKSIAARKGSAFDSEFGEQFPKGVWSKTEDVYESAVFVEYHDMIISLLIFPDNSPKSFHRYSDGFDGLPRFDTFDQFQKNSY